MGAPSITIPLPTHTYWLPSSRWPIHMGHQRSFQATPSRTTTMAHRTAVRLFPRPLFHLSFALPGAGTCTGTGGENGWLCQHRWPAITGMVRFRMTVSSDSSISNWVSPQTDRIAFGRGAFDVVEVSRTTPRFSHA